MEGAEMTGFRVRTEEAVLSWAKVSPPQTQQVGTSRSAGHLYCSFVKSFPHQTYRHRQAPSLSFVNFANTAHPILVIP